MSTILVTNLAGPSGSGTDAILDSVNGGQLAGMRNRIINGAMTVDQRNGGASQSLSPGLKYTVDRWFVSATGGTVTGQRTTGASANQFQYTITGAAGVTDVLFGQRIEAVNSADLAGKTITISCRLITSAKSSIAWQLQRANATDDFSGVTSIASGTFSNGLPGGPFGQSAQVTLPVDATTGLQIVLSTGALTSGTVTIRDFQLEEGTCPTPFERRSFGQELALCQRYYAKLDSFSTLPVSTSPGSERGFFKLPTTMRATPTCVFVFDAGTGATFYIGADGGYQNGNHSSTSGFSVTTTAEL